MSSVMHQGASGALSNAALFFWERLSFAMLWAVKTQVNSESPVRQFEYDSKVCLVLDFTDTENTSCLC